MILVIIFYQIKVLQVFIDKSDILHDPLIIKISKYRTFEDIFKIYFFNCYASTVYFVYIFSFLQFAHVFLHLTACYIT